MSTVALDPHTMPLEELRRQIEVAALTPEVPASAVEEPVVEQPRDEQGRFIKVEESEPTVNESTETQTETVEAAFEEVVEREIDLGDGSGVQLFRGVGRGASKEEAIINAYQAQADSFAKAQENATRKIRELTAKPTPAPTPSPVVEPTFNPDQEVELALEFQSEPSKAFDKLYQKRRQEELAREAEERRQAEEAQKAVNAAAAQFIAATPGYYETPKNAARIDRWLTLNGKTATFENIQAAYNDLNGDGLLVPKPTEAAPARTARTSGLSVRAAVQPPPKPTVDPSKLTLEQLRDLAGGYVYPQ